MKPLDLLHHACPYLLYGLNSNHREALWFERKTQSRNVDINCCRYAKPTCCSTVLQCVDHANDATYEPQCVDALVQIRYVHSLNGAHMNNPLDKWKADFLAKARTHEPSWTAENQCKTPHMNPARLDTNVQVHLADPS